MITSDSQKSTFYLETHLKNEETYSAQELYNFSHTGLGTDFVFIFNAEFNNKKYWVYVKESVVAAGSLVLGAIMRRRRDPKIPGQQVDDYYAMLDHTTGYPGLDISQFRRMIEVRYLHT